MPKVRPSKNHRAATLVRPHLVPPHRRADTATAAARDLGPCVYVVRTHDDLIKIGFTTNLVERIRTLGLRWSDLQVAMPGSMQDERALHARFALYLARGREYFFPAIEVMAWIDDERARIFGVSDGQPEPPDA